ncbi:MAG: DUF3179 domain-containing protein [Maribacter sp.]
MKKKIPTILFVVLLIISCSSSDASADQNRQLPTNSEPNNSSEWLYPISEIRDGGPGKDGIPSIDAPNFASAENASSILSDNLLVVGIKVGEVTQAYPHFILDWHEIVNDNVNGVEVAISLCPLTGTSIGWSNIVNGSKTSFGVSGKLYNNNLIPYDRATNSNWSQVGLQCINGSLIGERPDLVTVLETTWGVWKTMYPDTKVLTTNTGFSRNYGVYPYGDYRTNNSYLIFPLTKLDNRIPAKERVHSIINDDEAKVYRFNTFGNGNAIRDAYKGVELLLVGDNTTIVSFELDTSNSSLQYEYSYNNSEGFFTDNEGTVWNVFGEAISGPRQGDELKPTASFIAYWFSIGAFYPEAGIYE